MAAQMPRRNKFSERVRAMLRRGRPRSVSSAAPVILPTVAMCFKKRLWISMPQTFRELHAKGTHILYADANTGMHLHIMQIPFGQPLQHITVTDLQIAFRKLISVNLRPEVTHGFLRYSPMLTAVWSHPPAQKQFKRGNVEVTLKKGAEKTVLRLIQVRKTVFLLLFTDVSEEAEPLAEAILYSVSVKTNQ